MQKSAWWCSVTYMAVQIWLQFHFKSFVRSYVCSMNDLFYIYIKISASQIWSSGSFEERLFPEALLSLFLSGGMIFISHLLRRLYFFISQSALHCIALYILDQFNLILLRHITGNIEWSLIFRSLYVSICYAVIKI